MATMQNMPVFAFKTLYFIFALGVIVLFLLLSIVPYYIPGAVWIKPDLFLIALYYWATHRPSLLPLWATFLAGLFFDIFSNFPPGFHAFIFILVRKVITDQRRILLGQTHLVFWLAFAILCVVYNLVKVAMFYILSGFWPDVWQVVYSALLTICLFPGLTTILIFTHRKLPLLSHDVMKDS